jgi:hypothetical protein
MTRSINNLILICIALLTISKSSLIGYGFLAFPDESRYGEVVKGVTNFLHGDIVAGLRNLFSIQGRPGEGFIKLIPAAIQLLSSGLSGLYIYDSFNSYPIFIFNFFTHALILLVHYKFCKLVFKDHFIALLCVLIYSVFTNSYLYIRHALPYDQRLLIL